MTTTNVESDASPAENGVPDWDTLRRDFPATEHCTYLDIGRKATLPRVVEQAMGEWIADVFENAGHGAYAIDAIEASRATLARVYGVPPDQLSLVKNTSEGVNIVAQGFPWREGDNVVINTLEHVNNTLPWRHLRHRGIETREAHPDDLGRVTVERLDELVDDRTRIIAIAWIAWSNGYRADIAAIAEYCHAKDIRLVVDGVQGVGVLGTAIADLGADVVVAGGHKAQLNIGGALMYTAAHVSEMLIPPYAAKFSFTSNDRSQTNPELAHDAHRFEYGNPNYTNIWVHARSAQYIEGIGLANIEARVRDLTTYLMEEAARYQLQVRTPRPWEERAGIVSLDLGRHAGPTAQWLCDQSIIVSEKDGHLRACPHFYNNEDDIDRFLDVLRRAPNH